jgi:hypothetical protein
MCSLELRTRLTSTKEYIKKCRARVTQADSIQTRSRKSFTNLHPQVTSQAKSPPILQESHSEGDLLQANNQTAQTIIKLSLPISTKAGLTLRSSPTQTVTSLCVTPRVSGHQALKMPSTCQTIEALSRISISNLKIPSTREIREEGRDRRQ